MLSFNLKLWLEITITSYFTCLGDEASCYDGLMMISIFMMNFLLVNEMRQVSMSLKTRPSKR